MGQACSMASLILASGAPGMRHSLPNARIMIHQPSGGVQVMFIQSFYSTILLKYNNIEAESSCVTDLPLNKTDCYKLCFTSMISLSLMVSFD